MPSTSSARHAAASLSLVLGIAGIGGAGLVIAPRTAAADAGQAPIIGGTAGTVGQFPTVVALQIGNGLCTGTLIDKEWILTAAHCVTPALVGVSTQAQVTANCVVVLDSANLFAGTGRQVRCAETIPNPGFNVNNLGDNDVGLIRLATPVTDRTPTPVNFDAATSPVGVNVTMVGYGVSEIGNNNSAGKLFVLTNRTSSPCGDFGVSDANLLCFDQRDGKGKCEGDSGGPSFKTVNGINVVVGITSFGDQTCQSFGADTRTDAEGAFVIQHVGAGIQCGADGTCAAACGQNGVAADPDCASCEGDDGCTADQACIDHRCQVAPFSPGGLGSTCTDAASCASGVCADGPGDDTLCSTTCALDDASSCPDGFACLAAGDAGACWPTSAAGGCCDAGQRQAPWGAFLLGALAVSLLATRRSARATTGSRA